MIDYCADVKKLKAFQLLKKKWTILEEMCYVLSIPYKATIRLQKRSLTLSDVFGIWVTTQLHLKNCIEFKKKFKTDLAKHLLSDISERKETVFKNPLMTAALFLDPRFRRVIVQDEEKMDEAKKTLKNIWRRLLTLGASANENDTSITISEKSVNSDSSLVFDDPDALDNYLAGNPAVVNTVVNTVTTNNRDIEQLLDSFDPPRLSSDADIMKYFQEIQDEQPELYQLAMIVFAIPPTEVQLERDFSKLNFIFSDRRCNLTEERLEDIMIIHLNDELFYKVKDDLLNSLLNNSN